MKDPLALLKRPEAYVAQIDRLRRKYGRARRSDALVYRGLSLADLGTQDRQLARRLARAVDSGAFRLSPVVAYPARIAGKERLLHRSNLVDTIVLGVLAQALAEICEPHLSPRLYSYRVGRSSWQVLVDLRRYLRAHRAARPDRKERGLYVLHRDIRSYGPSIPTDSGSTLWAELGQVLEPHGLGREHPVWELCRRAMRPEVEGPDGVRELARGVPTGSPIQPIACNLYLSSIDRLLGDVPGGFYARFGDDMLFCHPDPARAREVARQLADAVSGLGLEFKADKLRDLYWTGPGRPSVEHPDAAPTSQFDYLGYRIDMAGNVGLKAEKARRMLRELRVRAHAAAGLGRAGGPGGAAETAVATVCRAIAEALDPRSEVRDPAAGMLRDVVTDRRQLGQLDYCISLMVAETLSGTRGPRAFRHLSRRRLREAGLPSLVAARNARDWKKRRPS